MWPNGDFASPVGSFQKPVPVPGVDPLAGDCSIIRLNKAWLPYIRGALSQLWLESTWDTDAAGLINVQQQVTNLIFAFNDLEPGDCSPQPQPIGIAESDYEMSICEQLRYQNGILQGYCCGQWVDIQGQPSQGNVVPTQPGEGSPVPKPGGGSDEYCGAMGGTTWLLPIPVSTGDTLLFSKLGGAWKDSSDPLVWECPNGWNYALGACWERTPRGSPDPLPSGLHMQIIALINGVYYDVLAIDSDGTPTLFTVPSGISNATVELQANIDDIARVQGEISFCVDVTNNQLGTWNLPQDLARIPGGWRTDIAGTNAGQSIWVSGMGWVEVDCDNMLGGTGRYNVVFIHLLFTNPTTIKHFDMNFDAVVGDLADSGHQLVNIKQGATDNAVISTAPVTGDGQFLTWDGEITSATEIIVLLYGSDHNDGTCPPSGSARLYNVNMSGVGIAPF